MNWPRVLIYKRNHTGDPDRSGMFGCHDCMGKVRSYQYDAVIGIGVSRPWAGYEGIADRITWVGVGPRRVGNHKARGAPLIQFERWRVFDTGGKDFKRFAPRLAGYFYEKHRRYFFSDGLSDDIQQDIARILKLATPQRAFPDCPDSAHTVACPRGYAPRGGRKRKPVCRPL